MPRLYANPIQVFIPAGPFKPMPVSTGIPHPYNGYGFLRVRVRVGKNLPAGDPCPSLRIVVVVSPIVVDPQLPPLLQLLHLEVLVVAGLVVVTRVVVVVKAIVWARSLVF